MCKDVNKTILQGFIYSMLTLAFCAICFHKILQLNCNSLVHAADTGAVNSTGGCMLKGVRTPNFKTLSSSHIQLVPCLFTEMAFEFSVNSFEFSLS